MVASLTLLSPWGLLAILVAVVPVLAVASSARRAARAARSLRLPAPSPWPAVAAASTAGLALALVGLAAAQPTIETTQRRAVRSESQVMYVVDVSRSMLASSAAGVPTRLDRARDVVRRIQAEMPDVRAGLAGLTDRVLPYLFPTADPVSFDQALRRSVLAEQPPPGQDNTVATTFDDLGQLASSGYFARSATRRACVLVTDGEARTGSAEEQSGGLTPSSGGLQSLGSRGQSLGGGSSGSLGGGDPAPEDAGGVGEGAAALAAAGGCRLVVVRVGDAGDRIRLESGRVEGQYRPVDTAASSVDDLASAAGGEAFGEGDVAAAAASVRRIVDAGPTVKAAAGRSLHRLAPWLALAGSVLLGVLVALRALAPEFVHYRVFEYAESREALRGGHR